MAHFVQKDYSLWLKDASCLRLIHPAALLLEDLVRKQRFLRLHGLRATEPVVRLAGSVHHDL